MRVIGLSQAPSEHCEVIEDKRSNLFSMRRRLSSSFLGFFVESSMVKPTCSILNANLLRIGWTSSRLKTKFLVLDFTSEDVGDIFCYHVIAPSHKHGSPPASPSCRWIDSFPPRQRYLQGRKYAMPLVKDMVRSGSLLTAVSLSKHIQQNVECHALLFWPQKQDRRVSKP